jgi:hypothetical protein
LPTMAHALVAQPADFAIGVSRHYFNRPSISRPQGLAGSRVSVDELLEVVDLNHRDGVLGHYQTGGGPSEQP